MQFPDPSLQLLNQNLHRTKTVFLNRLLKWLSCLLNIWGPLTGCENVLGMVTMLWTGYYRSIAEAGRAKREIPSKWHLGLIFMKEKTSMRMSMRFRLFFTEGSAEQRECGQASVKKHTSFSGGSVWNEFHVVGYRHCDSQWRAYFEPGTPH